jgi:hypothetical protein
MATEAPERPGGQKKKIRRRISGRSKLSLGKSPFEKSPVLNAGNRQKNRSAGGASSGGTGSSAPGSPGDTIQPDFLNDTGGVGDEDYGPSMPMNDEGGIGDEQYGPNMPEADDKDNSNAEENSANEPQNDWAPPTGEAQNPDQSPDIAAAENNASPSDGQDTTGNLNREGFANDPDKGAWANAVDQTNRNKEIIKANRGKKKGIYGLIGGAGVTLAIVGAIISIPQLALNNALDKLTGAMSSRVSYAVEKRFEKYVGLYVTKSLMPSINACGGVIRSDCAIYDTNSGVLKRTFQTWNNQRLQDRLLNNHGVEFQLDRNNPSRKPDLIINGKNLGPVDQNISIRQLREKIKLETKNDEVIKRRHLRSVGNIYGLKWCASFKLAEGVCDVRNRTNDARGNVTSALKRKKLQLAARVVSPAGARGAAFMLCLVEGCDPDVVESAGFEESKRLFRDADGPEFERLTAKIGNRRISQFIVEEAMEKIIARVFSTTVAQTSARTAAGFIPIAGQVYLVATILDIADRIDRFVAEGGVSGFIYDRNTQASLAYTSTMVSSIEESGSFDVPLEEQGATFQLMQGYDQSRYYQSLNGDIAANNIECENDYVLAKNSQELVCPELSLKREVGLEEFRKNPVVNAIVEAGLGPWRSCVANLGLPGLGYVVDGVTKYLPGPDCPSTGSVVSPVLRGIDSVFGFVGEIVFEIVAKIPGVNSATDFLGDQASELLSSAVDSLLPLAVTADAVGWRAFDQMAAGFDFMYNLLLGGYEAENGQYQGFGAGEISPSAAAELDVAIAEWNNEKLQNQNIFARYLDIGNYDSLATTSIVRLSSILPFAGKPMDIGVSLSSMFGSIPTLFGGKASAATNGAAIYNEANFGNTQFAFTVDQLETDPESPELSDQNCAEEKAAYREARADENVAFSSLCMLDEAVGDIVTKALAPDAPGGSQGIGSGTTGQDISSYIDGTIIPCQGDPKLETEFFGPGQNAINWESVASSIGGPSGIIGQDTNGNDMMVFVRDACGGQQNVRTVVIASSIHGSENGGQRISFELLFNSALPADVRIIAIPEVNKSGIASSSRNNPNGVNLNRNFDYNWSGSGDNTPNSGNYRGPSAASEAETQNVQNFMTAVGQTNLFMAYHDCINKVFYSGEKTYAQSRPIAEAYVGKFNGGTASCNNKSWPWTSAPNRGGGFMEAWVADTTNSPALLVELNNSESADYMQAHANIVKELLEDGTIR